MDVHGRRRGAAAGFSLLELMVSLAVGLVVLAGALGAGVALQRAAHFEEETLHVQEALRVAADRLAEDVKRAGAGAGAARVALGATTGGEVAYGYAVEVRTAPASSGDYVRAPAPYTASDVLVLRAADARTLADLVSCSAGTATARGRTTDGSAACLATTPSGLAEGAPVLFLHAGRTLACAHRVTAAAAVSPLGVVELATGPRTGASEFPAAHACHPASGTFWGFEDGTPLLLREEVWGYRINWRAEGSQQRPVLQQLRADTGAWADLVHGVEVLKVRLGVEDPDGGPMLWFPGDGRPALDACTQAACEPLVAEVGGYVSRPSGSGARLELSDLPEGDPARARDALQRRVRAVEVTLVVRSQRRDEKQVVHLADGTFALDAEGLPRDGYRRRRTTLVLTPRNLLVAGGVAAAEAP